MSDEGVSGRSWMTGVANGALKVSASTWFLTAAIGQWIFLAYVIAVYGAPAAEGNFAEWNKHLSGAYVPGDMAGNLAAAAHLLLSVIILGGGPLQLMPPVRNRFPTFHRWLGRTYLVAVVVSAFAGLYMLSVRDIGELSLKLGFILQVILIVVFAAFALRHAMARNIDVHHRWAMRLFMTASAVWFFRIMLMIWFLLTGGVGVDTSTGKGPFLDVMAFGQYLPLIVLEIYFRVKDRGQAFGRFAMALFLFVAAAATALGVFMATVGMWFPSA